LYFDLEKAYEIIQGIVTEIVMWYSFQTKLNLQLLNPHTEQRVYIYGGIMVAMSLMAMN